MPEIDNHLSPTAQALLAAWSALPKRDGVPDRQDFSPTSVARILPVITLLQRIGDGEWRFRLVGTEIDRRWGRRVTGQDCIEMAEPGLAMMIRREFDEVVGHPCGSWSVRHIECHSSRRVEIETLRLPLRAEDGSVSLILGSSGEVPNHNEFEHDRPRAITAIVQQRFFDIGAGLPAGRMVP